MNKQELIEKFEQFSGHGSRCYIERNEILNLVKQLDEPQKVKVPPYVAVWYEINKDNLDKNIAYLCLNNWGEFINDKTLFNWMSNTDNFIEILVNMRQFGYEVEKEKRYLVKIRATKHYIAKDGTGKIFFFFSIQRTFYKKRTRRSWVRMGLLL